MDVKSMVWGICTGTLTMALSLPLAHGDQHRAGEMKSGAEDKQMQQSQQGQAGATDQKSRELGGLQVSKLIGSELKNHEDETLGTIEEVVLNRFGEVSYLALAPAEGIEAQGQYIAVPWHALSAGEGEQQVILPMAKDQLAQAPSLNQDKRASGDGQDLSAALDRYYLIVAVPALQQVSFSELDQDGNGMIDRREAMEADVLAQHFPAVDEDDSGTISTSEFSAFEEQVQQLREQGQQPGGTGQQPGAQSGQGQQQGQQPGGSSR